MVPIHSGRYALAGAIAQFVGARVILPNGFGSARTRTSTKPSDPGPPISYHPQITGTRESPQIRSTSNQNLCKSANGANGVSDIEGKVAKGSGEGVGKRTSFKSVDLQSFRISASRRVLSLPAVAGEPSRSRTLSEFGVYAKSKIRNSVTSFQRSNSRLADASEKPTFAICLMKLPACARKYRLFVENSILFLTVSVQSVI